MVEDLVRVLSLMVKFAEGVSVRFSVLKIVPLRIVRSVPAVTFKSCAQPILVNNRQKNKNIAFMLISFFSLCNLYS